MIDFPTIDRLTGAQLGTFDVMCPLCSPDRRSPVNRVRKVLRVWRTDRGFATWCCARCGTRGYASDHVARKRDLHALGKARAEAPSFAAGKTKDDDARRAQAMTIWKEAQDPRGTLIENYLAGRGLTLPDEAVGEAIRFHPACPFKTRRLPAMVALLRNVLTDEPRALHRTALTADGQKAEVNGLSRLSLGPVGGGAVKLTPDAEVSLCLGIGEGIESTLSMRLTPEFGASPVWSLLSAGQMAGFPVLAGIEALWIAVDHDHAGIKAARACAARWQAAGVEVFLVRPRRTGADLNDLAGA